MVLNRFMKTSVSRDLRGDGGGGEGGGGGTCVCEGGECGG